ncbi:hypothetical protein FA95DRAFT_305088 [Auriscalpium vulgare]|uniref:Uncharacterized protein n=1 Tax=Auriscalpium vulgare TaxID=40419 RepID=A0ACB8RKP4_9AGAM|nr:hypothetical protein FA95DRAFT_305088 [Auriscalpium vulgare]
MHYAHDAGDTKCAWNSLTKLENWAGRLLKASLSKNVCKSLKSVTSAIEKSPLIEEARIVKEINGHLKSAKACYDKLETFWDEEVRRLSDGIQTHGVQKDESDLWKQRIAVVQGVINDPPGDPGRTRLNSNRLSTGVPLSQDIVAHVATALIPSMRDAEVAIGVLQRNSYSLTGFVKCHDMPAILSMSYGRLKQHRRCAIDYLRNIIHFGQRRIEEIHATLLGAPPIPSRLNELRDWVLGLLQTPPEVIDCSELKLQGSDAASKAQSETLKKIEGNLAKSAKAWRSLLQALQAKDTVFGWLLADEDISVRLALVCADEKAAMRLLYALKDAVDDLADFELSNESAL